MHIEKHDLEHEFPEYRDRIRQLRLDDKNFARLSQHYHEVDDEVRRIERGNEASDELHLEERKKVRLHLKDELYRMLKEVS